MVRRVGFDVISDRVWCEFDSIIWMFIVGFKVWYYQIERQLAIFNYSGIVDGCQDGMTLCRVADLIKINLVVFLFQTSAEGQNYYAKTDAVCAYTNYTNTFR